MVAVDRARQTSVALVPMCGEVANKLEALVCEVQERDMDLNDESFADAMPFCAHEACHSKLRGNVCGLRSTLSSWTSLANAG